jgi:hypothetical protein
MPQPMTACLHLHDAGAACSPITHAWGPHTSPEANTRPTTPCSQGTPTVSRKGGNKSMHSDAVAPTPGQAACLAHTHHFAGLCDVGGEFKAA